MKECRHLEEQAHARCLCPQMGKTDPKVGRENIDKVDNEPPWPGVYGKVDVARSVPLKHGSQLPADPTTGSDSSGPLKKVSNWFLSFLRVESKLGHQKDCSGQTRVSERKLSSR